MKYTKEELQGMTNSEVNRTLFLMLRDIELSLGMKVYHQLHNKPDYCANPSDIMPLAFEYKINLEFYTDHWKAYKRDVILSRGSFVDVNPLRAIACCLILVLQDKQKRDSI